MSLSQRSPHSPMLRSQYNGAVKQRSPYNSPPSGALVPAGYDDPTSLAAMWRRLEIAWKENDSLKSMMAGANAQSSMLERELDKTRRHAQSLETEVEVLKQHANLDKSDDDSRVEFWKVETRASRSSAQLAAAKGMEVQALLEESRRRNRDLESELRLYKNAVQPSNSSLISSTAAHSQSSTSAPKLDVTMEQIHELEAHLAILEYQNRQLTGIP